MKTIFVSSTFKDMHFERDTLQEVVSPEVNKIARQYGEHVSFCDLRWGINTSELDSEDGSKKVLQVCLDEIDRCNPYMIVILGDRYGWIPSDSLISDMSAYKKLHLDNLRKSVTALEIEYGALNSRKKQRTLFYFREIKNEAPEEYQTEGEEHERLLRELKERILRLTAGRVKRYEVRWDGQALTGMDDFAEMLTGDIVELMKQEWEQNSRRSVYEKERYTHLCFVVEKNQMFRARKALADTFIQEIEAGKELTLIKAQPGSGKSTLLSYLAVRLKEKGYEVLPFICSLTPETNTAAGVLKQIVHYLEEQLKLSHFADSEKTLEEWKQRLEELVTEYEVRRKRIIIMLDALDQLSDDENRESLIFMPKHLSGRIQYVLTCLEDFRTFDRPYSVLSALDDAQKREVIEGILLAHNRELASEVKDAMLKLQAADTPLYLSFLLQRLMMMNQEDFHQINQRGGDMAAITEYQLEIIRNCPSRLQEMSAEVLRLAGERINPQMIGQVVRYIAVSRCGLRTDDLAGLLRDVYSPLDFSHFIAYMSDNFILREDGRYDFSHKSMREGVLREIDDVQSIHNKIFDYLYTVDEEDEIRKGELVYHGIRANRRQFLIDYVEERDQKGLLCWAAAEDLLYYTMQEDSGWIKELLQDESLVFQESFFAFMCHEFEISWDEDIRQRSILYTVREEMLLTARRYHQKTNTDASKMALARCLLNQGKSLCHQEAEEDGIRLYQECLALSEEAVASQPTAHNRLRLYFVLLELGRVLEREQREEVLLRALDTIRLVAEEKQTARSYLYLAGCYEELGGFYRNISNLVTSMEKASRMYLEGLKMVEKAASLKTRDCRKRLVDSYLQLAQTYDELGIKRDQEKRREYIAKAIAIGKEIVEEEKTVWNYCALAESCIAMGHVLLGIHTEDTLSQALEYYERAEELLEAILKDVPAEYYFFLLKNCRFYKGEVYYELNRLDEALAVCMQIRNLHAEFCGMSGRDYNWCELYNLLGDIYTKKNDIEKAQECYRNYEEKTHMQEYIMHAFSEFMIIMKYLDDEVLNFLPFNICTSVKWHSSRLFQSKIDPKLPLEEQPLLPQTDSLITLLYMKYMSSDEEREEMLVMIKENEEETVTDE